MVEIALENLEKYLDDVLAEKYKKLRRVGKKMIDEIGQNMRIVSDEIDGMGKKVNPDKDDILNRSLARFVSSIQVELKKMDFQSKQQVTHADSKKVFDSLSSFFNVYNETGKKFGPKIGEQFKTELKIIQNSMIRVFKQNGDLDRFIRQKYAEAKDAEEIVDKIKRIEELIQKYGDDRKKIADLTASVEKLKLDLADQEKLLLDLEQDPLVAREQQLFREENRLKQEIQLELSKIKKGTKKFEKAIDSGSIEPRFIAKKDIKDYLKNFFESLIADGPEYPKLHAILENLAGSLDDEIQLKDDKKEKAQDIITEIKDKNSLTPLITGYLKAIDDRKEIAKQIQGKGTAERIATIKQKISDLTVQKMHAEADLAREKENVVGALNKMKVQKEAIEKEVQAVSKEKVTILLAL
ncbi:MAG: hypothetical protein GYA24_01560 [Candidatus Lokiarchaeota archaeon]|nr:hypothetical protein [Candidatus Lokiarchaeota archaeon]